MRVVPRRGLCHAVSDDGEPCTKAAGHTGTDYLHTTTPDAEGMCLVWGEIPEGAPTVACGECDGFVLVGEPDSVIIAHDHTDNSHSWIRSNGDVGSMHIEEVESD